MTIGKLWWTRIPNPYRLLNDILDSLSIGNSVIVNFPSDIPWADVFKETLEIELAENNGERAFDVHSASKAVNPGKFIFDKYCSPNEKNKYFPSESYERFMANNKNTVLTTKYVFVEKIPSSSAEKWVSSIKQYLDFFDEDEEHGIFILLNNGSPVKSYGKLVSYNYNDYISDYDCLMLCLSIVSELKCSTKEKQYIAEFANTIARGNNELAGQLAEYGFDLIEEPYKTVEKVFKDNNMSYTNLTKNVDSALWEAQTILVFPIVEAYRKYFSEKYESVLAGYLPFKDNITGQKITSVNELEIGHLFFLSDKHKFAEWADHDRLLVIKDARNDASHWNVIELDRFRKIIG